MESEYDAVIEAVDDLNALILLVRGTGEGEYSFERPWGGFDVLGLRAIDDMSFSPGEGAALYFFSSEPPRSASTRAIAMPVQVALERAFFHLQSIQTVQIDPEQIGVDGSQQQQGCEFVALPSSDRRVTISREMFPYIAGDLELGKSARRKPSAARAEVLLRNNKIFSALALARRARLQADGGGDRVAWFVELFALSFLGLPEEALQLYEEYPHRGSADPDAQFLAARFRLLLKQANEARTILHTLTFQERWGAWAQCELARSFIVDADYGRALDAAEASLSKDSGYSEARLVRALAQRGISYAAGEEEGLNAALRDLEIVAKGGGFNSAEALFHAGVIFARLGALDEAEQTVRQSLFQRDRFAARDALIRVLCTKGAVEEAETELAVLASIRSDLASDLSAVVAEARSAAFALGGKQKAPSSSETPSQSTGGVAAEVQAARGQLREWRIPIAGSLSDFGSLDDFINLYAPGGRFSRSLAFEALNDVGAERLSRALALHLGDLLVGAKIATWGDRSDSNGDIQIKFTGSTLQTIYGEKVEPIALSLDAFVTSRLLLGAGGDNLSDLASLLAEHEWSEKSPVGSLDWKGILHPANEAERAAFSQETRWARGVIEATGIQFNDTLGDLEALDTFVDTSFSAGGELEVKLAGVSEGEVDRLVVGLGLVLAEIVSKALPNDYLIHPDVEGVCLECKHLGRVFPVARAHRRVYLASGADYGVKFAALGISVGTAVVLNCIEAGTISSTDQVAELLRSTIPNSDEFSNEEIESFANALLARR